MKFAIALALALALITIAIGLHVSRKIDEKALGILLCAAIAGGLVIANYDVITKLSGPGGLSVETIREAKDKAVEDIKTEVDAQKDRLDMVIGSANESRRKLEQAEGAISKIMNDAGEVREKLEATIEMAKPPTLSLKGTPCTIRTGDMYEISFVFVQSKALPPGAVAFQARVNVGAKAKIVAFKSHAGILIGEQKSQIDRQGQIATLIYQPIGATVHKISLVVSGPLSVEISGSHMEKPVEYSVH